MEMSSPPPAPTPAGDNKEVPSIKRGFRGVFSPIQVFLNIKLCLILLCKIKRLDILKYRIGRSRLPTAIGNAQRRTCTRSLTGVGPCEK